MIGVHGLGGVGKTTLVEKVAKKMLDDGTFKQVPLAVVSKVLNVKEIQKKLADKLNLELKATADENAIAIQLWHKFKNGEKYLVILDDIWEKVDLNAIGIPIADGTTGCKVVLTSRNGDLLRITDRNFPIAKLSEAEAWDLFKKKVGNTIESRPEIDSLARQVCRKCEGLPVAINALGAALEDKQVHVWENALDKLEKHMLTQIEGIDPSVWVILSLSYEMLWSLDAKSCFLLCCLFAENAEIPIDELVRHCMARSLLAQNPDTFDEARTVVRTVVGVLKSASLLSTDDYETVVKIHDVIRDVGISIAHKEEDKKEAFLIHHGVARWPRNPKKEPLYSTISISFKDIKKLPDGLEYPQLKTLIVDNSKLSDIQVPENFFNGMTQLTVLTITQMRMRQLPSSFANLKNLQMLYLKKCELGDIAILKDLKNNLEVLNLRGSCIEELPPEIGQLTSLRVLDLQDCDELMVIPQSVISDLTSLEELYFPQNFFKWKATTDKHQDTSSRENVTLEDLRGLLSTSQLSTLHVYVPDVMLLPKEDLIFENLKGFKISVGSEIKTSEEISARCMLKLKGIQLRNEFIPLVDKAEVVVLSKIEGLKKVFCDRGVGNRFLDLKYLKVKSCVEELEYLLGEPKESVQSQHRLRPFNNLTVLIIEYCMSKYLFSPTTAKGLVHLEELKVRSCNNMEGIVGVEERNDEDEFTSEVKFNKLKQLELGDLPNLVSFYGQKVKTGTTMGSFSACARPLFSEKVIFPVLESLTIEGLDNIIKIWDKQSITHVLEEQGSFYQLKSMDVQKCANLMYVFPSNMHPQLKNLEKLEVYMCETMKGIAEFEGEIDEDGLRNEVAASPALDKQPLVPESKKEVESLCKLMDICIEKCGQLLYVFPSHMLPQNLQQLFIKECDELEVMFSKELKEKEAINNDIIVFPQLKEVTLWTLRKLKSFYTETQGSFFSHKVVFPVLKRVSIWKLDKITRIWDDQPLSEPEKEAKSFSKLEDIDVDGCDQLEYVLPSYMLFQLKNLQELSIESCTKVEVIISNNPKEKEATNNNDTIRLPQLKTVKLWDLPNLKSFICSDQTQLLFSNKVIFPVLEWLDIDGLGSIIKIWDKQSLAVLEDQGSFSQLTNLEVKHCSKLMHVFPSNMHPLLKNLERLEVNECETMKGIAEFEGEIDEDGLRNEVVASLALEVEHLEMVGVSKITEIRDKQPLVPEPKLMDIRIEKCGQLLYVFPSHMLPQNLQELEIEECDELEVIFSKELKEKEAINNDIIVFPRLKAVTLKKLRKLKSFYFETQGCFFSHKVIFPILDSLTIDGLGNIIKIWDKQSIAHVLEEQGSFCQLKSVNVQKCAKLIHVFPSNMHPQLKNLERLEVKECETMKEIAEFEGEIDEDGLRNEVAASPALEVEHLEMVGVPKITEIRDKQPLPEPKKEVESLCKLMDIRIEKCGQLLYVFPSHMLPQNLQELWIKECDELEVIFSKELKEKEAINNDIIVFPQLKEVTLWTLRKLKSFYTETQGSFFSHKVVFPVLKQMWFWNLDKITRIWDDQPLSEPEKEAKSFSELDEIFVKGCDQLEYVLPSYMLPQLKNLQELSILNCTKVEVIISNNPKEKEATNNNDTIRFPQLKEVCLEDLPNLKSFICSDETQSIFSNEVAFPVLEYLHFINLNKITRIWDNQPLSEPEKEAKSFCELMEINVDGCNQLEYVLPFYMLPLLKNLRKLLIRDCRKMEVIIISNNPKEKEATNNNDTIRFPQLKTLELWGLPNLKSFICSETQLFFSNKDAFPVLEEIDLDEDSEILRDGTYTKEVSMENNKMADTSAAPAWKGKDIQGIPWERFNIAREKWRQTRLEQYKNYEDIPQSGERSEKDCKVTMKGGMYYEFRHYSRSVKSKILHDKLRNLVWATSKHDVYFMTHFSVTHWSALTWNKTEVLNVSRHVAPCEEHPGSLLEGFTQTEVITLAVKDRLLVAGGFQGELICKNLDRPGVCFCTRTTYDDNARTNVVEIYNAQSGAVHFTAANNDCGVRDFDMENFQLSKHFSFPWPVNHTSMSPDGKLRIIVGDNPEGMLVDSGTGKMVASLVGHLDFSFASAWHPDGLTFATGNQDKTCRIWDARNLSKSVAALKGNHGAIQSIRYSSDGHFMAMAEPADFVHVFDAKSGYEKEQEIDFFGEISGMSFSPDTESLFIGVCDANGQWDHRYDGLLEFGRRRNTSCPDSII